jgi:sigma-E factor negative regulatory protein RseA
MNASDPSAPNSSEAQRAQLSALCDGDLAALEDGCRLWRDDAEARATWHTYHLIGDVLRSDDLAATPRRDAAFLAGLRERLATEPVVLAPAKPRRRQLWQLPAAAAAGFAAVAGIVTVLQVSDGTQPAVVAKVGSPPAPQPVIYTRVVRDPVLDRYLNAHRNAVPVSGIAVPGGAPRNYEAMATAVPMTPAAASVAR